jgi:hypothetical protein
MGENENLDFCKIFNSNPLDQPIENTMLNNWE